MVVIAQFRLAESGGALAGELTSKRIGSGCLPGVEDLEQAITEFMAAWNENPKPFVWTATVESPGKSYRTAGQTLEQIRPGCTLPYPDGANEALSWPVIYRTLPSNIESM
jgi:hypothetical protein